MFNISLWWNFVRSANLRVVVVLDPHDSDGENVADEVRGQLEAESQGLEVGPLHPEVLRDDVSPEAEADEVGGDEVLEDVVLLIDHGGDVAEEAVGGAVQLLQLQLLHLVEDLEALQQL